MVNKDRHAGPAATGTGRPRGVARRAIAYIASLGLAWSLALGIATPMAATDAARGAGVGEAEGTARCSSGSDGWVTGSRRLNARRRG